jgi:hypothetical protein
MLILSNSTYLLRVSWALKGQRFATDYLYELGEITMAVPPESRQVPRFLPVILDRLAVVDGFKRILG